ncbi:MAG TPA: hypothetical protein VGP70_18940 [Actinomadura sp.]|jgi:hypothetical protein|nr:hypothetical protein [Actinomadura sp.]
MTMVLGLAAVGALGATAWGAGGLEPAPRPKPAKPGEAVDQGRFRSQVLRATAGWGQMDIVLRVTNLDRKTVPVSDYVLNAVSLDVPLDERIGFVPTFTEDESKLLYPGATKTVVLRGTIAKTPRTSFRVLLHAFVLREDFFYGFKEWKSEKDGRNPRESAIAEVTLPVHRKA